MAAGTIAIDGTKVHASTRRAVSSRSRVLEQADAVDAVEDEQFGEAGGDELPPELQSAQGRRGWLRERRLDERRAQEARAIARSRPDRLCEAKRRLEEVEGQADAELRT